MNGDFTFDGREWPGLEILSRQLPPPEVKTKSIDVPGLNGVIDLSDDFFGSVRYKNRPITLTLGVKDKETFDFHGFYTAVHGRAGKLVFAETPAYYYTGRATVTGTDTSEDMTKIGLLIDAEPFRYNAAPTVLAIPIASQKQRFQFGDYLESSYATGTVDTARYDELSDSFVVTGSAGSYANFDLMLPEGAYFLEYTSSGSAGVRISQTDYDGNALKRPAFFAMELMRMRLRITMSATGTATIAARKYKANPVSFDTGANCQVPSVNAPGKCYIAQIAPGLHAKDAVVDTGYSNSTDLELAAGAGLLAAFDYYNSGISGSTTITYQRGDI